MTGFFLAWAFVLFFGIVAIVAMVGGPEGSIFLAIWFIGIVVMWQHNVFDHRSDIVVYTEAKEKCVELKGELFKTERRIRYECRISPTIVIPVD